MREFCSTTNVEYSEEIIWLNVVAPSAPVEESFPSPSAPFEEPSSNSPESTRETTAAANLIRPRGKYNRSKKIVF